MSKSREVKTAVLVIVSILLFIWGYSFLKSRSLFSSNKTIYVLYDNVDGLMTNAMVTLNGVNVGKVDAIEFLNTSGQVLVTLSITSDFPISKSSQVKIYEPSLIGAKQVAIAPNFKDKVMAKSGDTLQSGTSPGLSSLLNEKLVPLEEKIASAIVNVDSLLVNLNSLLSKKGNGNIGGMLADLDKTLKNVASITKNADLIVSGNKSKLDNAITNLDKTLTNFSGVSKSLNEADLGKTVKTLETTLANVNKIMVDLESGKGTMGKLLKDEAMYNNLTNASKELELLLADLKNNPKRYVHISVFGKKAEPYKPTK